MRFMPPRDLLSVTEMVSMVGALHEMGVDELRVTGGEPTLRPEFDAIMKGIAQYSWKQLGLTTNGILLKGKLPLLKDLGVKALNISLDSLDEARFNEITRRKHFQLVLNSILAAKAAGFAVKVNCIVFRGMNDHEIPDFIRFSENNQIEVRFLELMKVGPGYWNHPERFVSAQEMMDTIRLKEELISVAVAKDSTSFVFTTHKGARIGFIASESQPFCGQCSRLRLSANGVLRACLFSEQGENLRGMDPLDYPEILARVMNLKPISRIHHIHQPMNQIGG